MKYRGTRITLIERGAGGDCLNRPLAGWETIRGEGKDLDTHKGPDPLVHSTWERSKQRGGGRGALKKGKLSNRKDRLKKTEHQLPNSGFIVGDPQSSPGGKNPKKKGDKTP